ncbi:MAG: prepilin peptidase [Planctomycetaceae bacterium]|nr:prepilin peptidase [Planctomycetaceae bacterium]MCB9951166.1 prepilin peptidase [Planctomycetaceae bacterium]MCB9954229.1 prepilin peptidase [Planctomycetaceae bacterium]
MFSLHPATLIMIAATGIFTAAAAVWDTRTRRIPNFLTLPMLGLGLVYQIAVSFMFGWEHLLDGVLGFVVGFGILFVLWFVGSGGAGDVKLMGALSIWLGFRLTLYVLFVSICAVILGTVGVVLFSVVTKGFRNTKSQYVGTGKTPSGAKPKAESVDDKQKRRFMAFATPVAIATWAVLLWKAPTINEIPQPNTPSAPVTAPAE